MQTVSTNFTDNTASAMRPLFYKVFMSPIKDYEPEAIFFTIGESSIGSNDPLRGTGTVIQEWDKYNYEDISHRVLSLEYNRETDPPINTLSLATASFTVDNHDDMFTPTNQASPYYGYLKPKRPVKIQIGFDTEAVQVFVGLTEGIPEIDEASKTATFRCIDFLSFALNKSLDQTELFLDKRADEIISSLLQSAGIGPSQMNLDVATVVIPFAFFDKGEKYIDAINKVVEAELGNLSLSEDGIIQFQNRINWTDKTLSWEFTKDDDLYDLSSPTDRNIINVVEVKANPRRVMDNQPVWDMESSIEIPGGATHEQFVDFKDSNEDPVPVVSLDEPEGGGATSFFVANDAFDGTGADRTSDLEVTELSLFSTSAKIAIKNNGANPLYITELVLHGEPALPIYKGGIYVRVSDDDSIGEFDGFDENPHPINNDLIQDEATARSLGQIIVYDRSEIDDQRTARVKGVPQLQIGDLVRLVTPETDEQYFVTRINGILDRPTGFTQTLYLTKRTIRTFFRVGYSSIGGGDELAV